MPSFIIKVAFQCVFFLRYNLKRCVSSSAFYFFSLFCNFLLFLLKNCQFFWVEAPLLETILNSKLIWKSFIQRIHHSLNILCIFMENMESYLKKEVKNKEDSLSLSLFLQFLPVPLISSARWNRGISGPPWRTVRSWNRCSQNPGDQQWLYFLYTKKKKWIHHKRKKKHEIFSIFAIRKIL